VFLVRLQNVVLEIGQERAHLGVHHFVLEVRVGGQLLDDAAGELALLGRRVLAGRLELLEQSANGLVVVLEYDDGVGGHVASWCRKRAGHCILHTLTDSRDLKPPGAGRRCFWSGAGRN
jgi:hypothetical protein